MLSLLEYFSSESRSLPWRLSRLHDNEAPWFRRIQAYRREGEGGSFISDGLRPLGGRVKGSPNLVKPFTKPP